MPANFEECCLENFQRLPAECLPNPKVSYKGKANYTLTIKCAKFEVQLKSYAFYCKSDVNGEAIHASRSRVTWGDSIRDAWEDAKTRMNITEWDLTEHFEENPMMCEELEDVN